MKPIYLVLLSPVIAIVLIVLIVCLTICSPLIFLHFTFVNKKRQSRRQSDKHPLMTILSASQRVRKSAQ
jgi:hypothetical protein